MSDLLFSGLSPGRRYCCTDVVRQNGHYGDLLMTSEELGQDKLDAHHNNGGMCKFPEQSDKRLSPEASSMTMFLIDL